LRQPSPSNPAAVIYSALLGLLGVAASACNAASLDEAEEPFAPSSTSLIVTRTFQQGMSGYSGSTDATMREPSRTTTRGAAPTCEADGAAGSEKSCLLSWTLSEVPSDAIITSATITLRITDPSRDTYYMYPLADRAHSSIGSVSGKPGSTTITLNDAGIAMVQAWLSAGNHGVVIAGAANRDAIAFASSEHDTPWHRPALSITYLTVGGARVQATAAARMASRDPR
jgi:hypothetical protein